MFSEYSDSDDDTNSKYEDNDGYIGAAERKKIKKKINKRKNETEEDEEQFDADDDEIPTDDTLKPSDTDVNPEDAHDELDYQVSIHASPYALFKKVIKFVPPDQHMASDTLSNFDYADLVSKETQRIERSDYLLINPGTLDCADRIAEATINARKSIFKINKHVGHEIDFEAKIIYELCEVHTPNTMIHKKVNASERM
jgi:hypothetical protein